MGGNTYEPPKIMYQMGGGIPGKAKNLPNKCTGWGYIPHHLHFLGRDGHVLAGLGDKNFAKIARCRLARILQSLLCRPFRSSFFRDDISGGSSGSRLVLRESLGKALLLKNPRRDDLRQKAMHLPIFERMRY